MPSPPQDGPEDRPPPEDWDDIPRPAPSPDSVAPGAPARRFGAPIAAAVQRIENIRLTRPDLDRRAALERTRTRLLFSSGVFAFLFLVVIGRLSWVTVIAPRVPGPGERPSVALFEQPPSRDPEQPDTPARPVRGPRQDASE